MSCIGQLFIVQLSCTAHVLKPRNYVHCNTKTETEGIKMISGMKFLVTFLQNIISGFGCLKIDVFFYPKWIQV